MKVRDMRSLLKSRGCTVVRRRGSHEMWRTPAGITVPVVVNHPNADIPSGTLGKILRWLEGAHLTSENP